MELRVPGIGGPGPESVLGCPQGFAVPSWRSEPDARSLVRRVAGKGDVNVYDWRPLTSGSRSFVIWPLLLPFTLVNVAGWTCPIGRTRSLIHRAAVTLVGFCATASLVIWLLYAGYVSWFHVVKGHPAVVWWLAVASATLAVALIVLGATYSSHGFERYRPESWTPKLRRRSGAGSARRELRDERFYDDGRQHTMRWTLHVLTALATVVVVNLLAIHDGLSTPGETLNRSVVFALTAPFLAVAVITVGGLLRPRRTDPALIGAGAAALGVMLLSGLVVSALTTVFGISELKHDPATLLFDVFGYTVVGVALATAIVMLVRLQTSSAPEQCAQPGLVPTLVSRYRARVSTTIGGLVSILRLCGVALPIATLWLMWVRWFRRDHGETWILPTRWPGVAVATAAFSLLLATLVINLVKSKANPVLLRRIGNIWDILGVWPRSYHPFAVRPYAERAVPELREYLRTAAADERVVVCAHSQGSVIAYAALLPEGEAALRNVALVTFGSPLRSLYQIVFPAYFNEVDFVALAGRLGGAWRNVYRCTDHVGQSVFEDVSAAITAQFGQSSDGRDVAWPDPQSVGGPVQGHNNYWTSAAVRQAVATTEAIWNG